MKPVVVLPGRAAARVGPLFEAIGWLAEPARPASGSAAGDALALGAGGRPVLFVGQGTRVSASLERILLLHRGSRAERPAVVAADEAAVATGAEIVVVHTPSLDPATGPASLPFRLGDHAEYDWAEWREEFLQRFCRYSAGVRLSLRVAMGPPVEAVQREIADVRPQLVVTAGILQPDDRRGALEALVEATRRPTLIVAPTGRTRQAARGRRSGSSW